MSNPVETPYDRLLRGFDELVARVHHLEERLMIAEGAWQRHGLEMSRSSQELHSCQRLHCGCGESVEGHVEDY